MTIESRELFELCKDVYKRTGWDEKKFYKVKGLDFHIYLTQLPSETKSSVEVEYPLYTSDYLLDKLPKFIDDRRLTLQPVIGNRWDASYDLINEADDSIYDSFAKTPLKALLKLSIELHKEKIL